MWDMSVTCLVHSNQNNHINHNQDPGPPHNLNKTNIIHNKHTLQKKDDASKKNNVCICVLNQDAQKKVVLWLYTICMMP